MRTWNTICLLNDRENLGRAIDNVSNNKDCPINTKPSYSEFYRYCKDLSNSQLPGNSNVNYEADVISFINEYDTSAKISCGTLIEEIINNNFNCNDIECAIDALKLNKSPGKDSIPAKFIKACKHSLAETITKALDYTIQNQTFPESWASVIRSAVFQNGQKCQMNNFRGITSLPIMEKIFQAAVYIPLSFVNEAFAETDK